MRFWQGLAGDEPIQPRLISSVSAFDDDVIDERREARMANKREPEGISLLVAVRAFVFSLVKSLLLRPLPVTNPQRLAIVSDARGSRLGFPASWTYAVWDEIRKRAQPFDGACAWSSSRVNLAAHGGETDAVDAMWVSGT